MNFSKKSFILLLLALLLVTVFSVTVSAATAENNQAGAYTEDYVTGDVNGDGKLTMNDILTLQKHIANVISIPKEKLHTANMDTVSMANILKLQKKIARLDPNTEVAVEEVVLDKTSAKIQVKESIALNASVLPQEAQDKTVTFSTSDSKVAVVDEHGNVTGLSAGKATISANSEDCNTSSTCTVSVLQPVESVVLNTQKIKWVVGRSGSFKPEVYPENASDKTLTWASSNKSVATVSAAGKLSAHAPGKATVTCSSENGIKVTCAVTVVQEVEKITLNKTSGTLTEKGKSVSLSATLSPKNATDKKVSWSTSNKKVATVSASGVVKAVANGSATITCKANDGYGAGASYKITVKIRTVGEKVAEEGKSYAGKLNYVWGGTSLRSGVDCSGFVCALYEKQGYSLWGYRTSLRNAGTGVSYANAKPGDIICYPGHVAIYIGNGKIVHAANSRSGVIISDVSWGGSISAVRRIA